MGIGKDIRDGFQTFATGVKVIGSLATTVRSVRKAISADDGPLGLGVLPAAKGLVSGVQDRPSLIKRR